MARNLIYDIHDKPKFGSMLIFAFQQVLAILAATILVPAIVGNGMSQSAALFGAGVGTIVYQLFTKFRSPVFLGSSFAFIGSMCAAFAGAVSISAGYAGLIIGAVLAGLVYVVIALIIKFAGVAWLNKLMPTVVIGPTVALIGLSLSVNAVNDLYAGKVLVEKVDQVIENGVIVDKVSMVSGCSPYVAILCGLITLGAIFAFSVFGKKNIKLIPFVLGILVGYVASAIFTVIGILTDNVALQVINFAAFKDMQIFAIPISPSLKHSRASRRLTARSLQRLPLLTFPLHSLCLQSISPTTKTFPPSLKEICWRSPVFTEPFSATA